MKHEVGIFQVYRKLVPFVASSASDTARSTEGDHVMSKYFTPEDSALLLIDHQVGTMQLIKNIDVVRAKRMSLALAKTASILGIPTVLTSSQEDRLQGPLLPELKDILPDAFDKRVKREGIVNAWTDANFKAAVEATGRKNLIMAGVTTDVCLVFPAIDAVAEGYKVQAVMDASGSPFELSEDMSRRRMQDAGVVLTATNTMIAELVQNWGTPNGQKLIQLLFTDVLPPIQS
jgi:nicotinamidase-related amidase